LRGRGLGELAQVSANLFEPALLERRVEQRPRVHTVDDAH